MLHSNEIDKCEICRRPVWKDNYYIVESKYYCSDNCHKKAVKKYNKENILTKNLNINHIKNEYFRMQSISELRKEKKELYAECDLEPEDNDKNNPELGKEVSNLIIDSISAKLSILNKFSEIN